MLFGLVLHLSCGSGPAETSPSRTTPQELSLEEARKAGVQESMYRNRSGVVTIPAKPEPSLDTFHQQIAPTLQTHCVSCHGPEKTKGNIRIDNLDPNLLTGESVDWWLEILAVLNNGEMPPPEKSKLAEEDRARVVEWLSGEIQKASIVRRSTGETTSFRRMTRYEYNYALQDLLGIRGAFARDLPPEAHTEDGFENSSELLQMSVSQLESYRQIAQTSLSRAIVRGPRPPMIYWGATMDVVGRTDWREQEEKLEKARKQFQDNPAKQKEELDRLLAEYQKRPTKTYFQDLKTGRMWAQSWNYGGARHALKPLQSLPEVPESTSHVAIIPQGQNLLVELGNQVPDEGLLRVRVRASRTSVESDSFPSLQLEFGWQASNEGRARLRVSEVDLPVTASPEAPEFYQWEIRLADIYPRNSVRKTSALGTTPSPSEYIRLVNCSASPGDIQVDYVEVSAPVYEEWPPASHQRLLIRGKNHQNDEAYAREILSDFMHRAWRRRPTEEEIERKLRLFQSLRGSCDSFEETLIETLASVLSSPNFLYLVQSEDPRSPIGSSLSQHELATRLSTFLWCSIPDEHLLDLAERGELSRPNVLAREVGRMLADPRSERLATHFVRQWLDLQALDFVPARGSLNLLLKEAMQEEPIQFFREVLRQNESILNFIHADYVMVNERLALHYGVKGVHGNHFRRVALEPDHLRGGLLTQAGPLVMTSSGTDSNPLKRGIWMLKSLLNDPPPPPPPAVPIIDVADPRIAQMTLKERLEDHRNQAACLSCHSKIDPWGIAFENYDALGRWRTRIGGKPIDASSRLFNSELLDGMDGLKRFLLRHRQDQFVRAIVHKLCVYALGRPLTFADRSGVEEITVQLRLQGDGLATLVQQVVLSELFLSK